MITEIHGLRIEVPDSFRCPPATSGPGALDFSISVGEVGPDPTFVVDNLVEVRLSPDGLVVSARTDVGPLTLEHYAIDHALPLALTSLGMPILHAAGVGLGARSVLLAGDSGAGKSTLSLWLATRGWTFFGDDGMRTDVDDDGLTVFPALPNARIHPDSRAQLFLSLESEGPVANYGAKQRLLVPAGSFANAPGKALVYVTVNVSQDSSTPTWEKLSTSELARDIAEQSFYVKVDGIDAGVARIDSALARAAQLRGYRLTHNRTPEALPVVEEMLRTALEHPSL